MKYDLSDDHDIKRFQKRQESLLKRGVLIELKELTSRSLRQNNYLYLILSALAMETGYSVDCVKNNFFKVKCNEDLFLLKTDGPLGCEIHLRSTADLTKGEMTTAIDRFRNWSANEGYYLPSPNEEETLKKIAVQADKMKQYL